MSEPAEIGRLLDTVGHRPWPLPADKWTWRQSWLDLAFMHYRVPAETLRPLLPPGVRLQEFAGTAWVGIVPFRMAGVARTPLPGFPLLPPFPELNLRTYVEAGGKPGVWFFSLDADSWPIVFGGRQWYNLPYFAAEMRQEWTAAGCEFTSRRHFGRARFSARYRPVGKTFFARPGTFEHWAAERYCLYAFSRRHGVSRVEIHHAPWPLQAAKVEVAEENLLAAAGLVPTTRDPLCHFSTGVHVVAFARKSVTPDPT